MTSLDPAVITIRDRQRRDPESLDDQFVASVGRRLIHPIVIRRDSNSENPILVVGGRRLAALIKLGTSNLIEGTHFRYMDDLSPTEAKMVELEENVKRKDLPWRDHTAAVGELHDLYKAENGSWTAGRIAKEINMDPTYLSLVLAVFKNLESPLLKDSSSIEESYRRLQTAAERRAATIVSQITEAGSNIFSSVVALEEGTRNGSEVVVDSLSSINNDAGILNTINDQLPPTPTIPSEAATSSEGVVRIKEPEKAPIINASFLDWIASYSGPKFNLIHCDFPFGIGAFQGSGMKPNSLGLDYEDEPDSEVFWELLNSLCQNLDKIASYSSHIMFWFSMNHYIKTKETLEKTGLMVLNHPLVWHKSDDRGIIPGRGNHPRRVYETALLCSRGQRPLTKKFSNCYSAPTATNPIHPSQKPEPVLRYFFSGLVDETTDVLDPTAGSGTALRAAEDCGARSVLGLELDPEFTKIANSTTLISRALRKQAKS